jgi:RimJ/RimL family protein N-acetyltransferase
MSLDGLDLTVVAHTVPSNVASQRVLEHVGFTRVESEPGPDGSEMIAWHLVMSARSDQTVKGPKTR